MHDAFEAAWARLRESGRVEAQPYKAEATREALALRIINQTQAGLLDPDRLRDDALAHALNEDSAFQMKIEEAAGWPERVSAPLHKSAPENSPCPSDQPKRAPYLRPPSRIRQSVQR